MKIIKKIFIVLFFFSLINWLMPKVSVFASSTDGTIDSTYKYAWGENIGWINFGTSNGNVHIMDSGLSGYALGENVGWIYLGGITNDGEGNLSGYAWSENTGWIKFNPTNGGVVINSSGEFTGSALGETVGWIIFGGDYKVKTDWRPRSARPACNNALDDDGDGKIDYPNDLGCSSLDDNDETDIGGGLPPVAYNPPAPPPSTAENPEGKFSVVINNDDKYTNSQIVKLKLSAGPDTQRMSISNSSSFENASQILYQEEMEWKLDNEITNSKLVLERHRGSQIPNKSQNPNSKLQTVYAKFYTSYGIASETVSDSIILKYEEEKTEEKPVSAEPEKKPTPEEIIPKEETASTLPAPKIKPPIPKESLQLPTGRAEKPPKPPIIEKVPEILKPLIPEFLKPKPPETKPPEVPIEELVSKEAPVAFQGKWQLLPQEPIREFVLAPLPREIKKLTEKFPKLGETLEKVGITKITDIEKLKSAKLTLPGLTERVGLPMTKVKPGEFTLPADVPVAKLSAEIKKQIPSEIVFAKTGGELIDFNIALTVSEKGEPEQKITTISGKLLQLVVKPDKPVKSVKGYVVWKQKNPKSQTLNPKQIPITKIQNSKPELSLNSLLTSVFFALPSFAKTYDPVEIETRLVLLEFEYTDPDGDGIYTAEIQAPLIEGEYEIITVMDFEDPELGKKEIRLTTVIDPEGYIYEKDGDKETRIPSAIVSLFWLNPETKQYELWPAKEYQQENPQITDITGKYSFLAPEGNYYLKVEAPGYLVYDGKPFQVKEGSGIHVNIELKTKYWRLKIIDWKTILLIAVTLLLMYNFYRDKMRDRIKK